MIRVVTDSTAYLQKDIIKKYGISVVPLSVEIEGKIYREGVDITDDEFYELLLKGFNVKTSQPTPNDFLETYKNILSEGDEIISIHISSKLSGTVNAANAAKALLGTDKITVIDSKSASEDLAYKVEKACELANEGKSRDEIEKYIEKYYFRVFGYFLPMDINYLKRGGRINNFQHAVSSVMKLFFIVHLNEGRIDPLQIVRTEKKAKKELMNLVKRFSEKQGGIERGGVVFGGNKEEGEEYRKEVSEFLGINMRSARIGPVLGAHLGPRFLGIAFVTNKEAKK
ncbi:MAG: DegV family protein [Caldisericaceae bacterium]|nr:DegV family protein [Caldisericaceae bacterium]